MAHKKDRGPKARVVPTKDKRPISEFCDDWKQMRPAWRVSLLTMHTPFGWLKIDQESARRIQDRLASYESMRWKEIMFSYRSHLIKRTDLCPEAQAHLEAIEQDDVDSVMSLGITQTERVFGILEHNVLKVLWWDPEHEVCPSRLD